MNLGKVKRTREVLELVFAERESQEAQYGEENIDRPSGTGPSTCWLGPYTGDSADQIQRTLRTDYEEFEDETGRVTWVHLIREEIAEAFEEDDNARLASEMIQVAALCVAFVETLDTPLRSPLASEEQLANPLRQTT
jgi:hypothetical protein